MPFVVKIINWIKTLYIIACVDLSLKGEGYLCVRSAYWMIFALSICNMTVLFLLFKAKKALTLAYKFNERLWKVICFFPECITAQNYKLSSLPSTYLEKWLSVSLWFCWFSHGRFVAVSKLICGLQMMLMWSIKGQLMEALSTAVVSPMQIWRKKICYLLCLKNLKVKKGPYFFVKRLPATQIVEPFGEILWNEIKMSRSK